MKKLWFLALVPVLGGAAVLVWQNLPEKRMARHMIKARLYAKENNLTAAQLEYEKAYNIRETFSPWVSLEVLELMNRKAFQDKDPEQALANSRKFVEVHPEHKEGRIILSHLALQAGDFETAFANIDAVLEAHPEYFPARMLLTRLRTGQGRLDLAEEQLRYLYRRYPDSVMTLLPLAENLLRQGKVEESRGFLREVLADHPRNASAKLMLVDSWLLERKPDSARAILDAWQETAGDTLARPLAVRRARFNALSGRIQEAEGILRPYLEPREENAATLLELAHLKVVQGQYDSAVRINTTLSENVPAQRAALLRNNLFLHLKNLNPARALETAKTMQVGNKNRELVPLTLACYLALGQDFKATALIEAQPDSLRPSLSRIVASWVPSKEYMGQWALTEYYRVNGLDYWLLAATKEFQEKWPGNGLAVTLFAGQLASLRQFAAAAKLMEAPARKDPGARGYLFSLYLRGGEREKAKALAEKMLAERPGSRGLHNYLADYAWYKGERETGVVHYRKELEANPDDLVALNNLAWEFGIVRSDFAQAKPYLDRLRKLKSGDARIWDTIGWILARNGDTKEGERYIRAALNLVPDHPSYLYHLGWILAQGGDRQGAKKLLQSAVDSRIPFEDRKAAEGLLAQQG